MQPISPERPFLGLWPRSHAGQASNPIRQAYHLLHFAFIAAPLVAGLDKFAHLLVNWNQYLAPSIARLSPIGTSAMMQIAGIVEIGAAAFVAAKPRLGGYVVAGWLGLIIVNLMFLGAYDIALRDFGLALGALALARLAKVYDRKR